ncbi:MAG: carboxylating nicotinate-nucleotide diphosphorylase [Pseudomonadota bacterium]|nr:carboxylating nicotinate-nucleotide diphosphorylase [Pseudomonadota bacterium]
MDFKKLSDLSYKKLNEELRDDLDGENIKNDITSEILITKRTMLDCEISNRDPLILCGSLFVEDFFKKKFPLIKINRFFNDGEKLKRNSKIFSIFGDSKKILAVERTVLNFLQHLSSIATTTNFFILKMKSKNTKLLDTRKTTTGLRKLEKYATLIGGAKNHRMGLYDEILIKDNHIKVLGNLEKVKKKLKINNVLDYKIECETIQEVIKCIEMGAKYILLDNMQPSEIKKCIRLKKTKKIKFEISGNITVKNINKYSQLGVDYISTSQITNCPNSVDIGLDII